ncbi:MAG: class I SAM-dependent methyltransferase [Armatimonadetes bacterium]|nr:class I SAM-dependent methyltransferase [Armatimonadota bacterium]
MNEALVPLLACPRRAGAPAGLDDRAVPLCGGALAVRAGKLPVLHGTEPGEVQEGLLVCLTCGQQHPILAGVAILVPQPEDYLRKYYFCLRRDLARHGVLSSRADQWLSRHQPRTPKREDYGADFRFSQQFEEAADVAEAMGDGTASLYGGFGEWLRRTRGENPYSVLAGWARDWCRDRGLALDAGCSAGGLAARVGPLFQTVIGVDLSFLAVLLARRTLLHRPTAERSYLLTTSRGDGVERPIPSLGSERPLPGAEFVVADCTAFPCPVNLFGAVFSSNVVDIAPMGPVLDEAVRVLRPGGMFLLTDPFYFRDGAAPRGDPREALRRELRLRGLELQLERDGVPWAWSIYDRHWRLYFNFCCLSRRIPS